jgi:hypothetical protein
MKSLYVKEIQKTERLFNILIFVKKNLLSEKTAKT